MLIAPEESDTVIARVKGFRTGGEFPGADRTRCAGRRRHVGECKDEARQGRAQRHAFARGTGTIVAANEPAHPHSQVDEKAKLLRDLAAKQNGRIRTSSFSSDPEGHEIANVRCACR